MTLNHLRHDYVVRPVLRFLFAGKVASLASPKKTQAQLICASARMLSTRICGILALNTRRGSSPTLIFRRMKASLEEEAAAILAEIAATGTSCCTSESEKRNPSLRLCADPNVILSEACFASRRIWASFLRARFRSCGIAIKREASLLIVCALLLLSPASAQTLNGTLKNGTTNKPAAGDDVVLIKLGEGMEEAARTKADAAGHFSFKLPDPGPHLIRAIHQGVTYHRMAPPGTEIGRTAGLRCG